jgi:iron complex outermembrane receptor protein
MTEIHSVRHAVRHALAIGALAALGASAFAVSAKPAPTPKPAGPAALAPAAAAPAALQTIVVTGSLISTTSVETPNPVQILTKAQIVQSGYTNMSDILRNISANGANTLSQSFSFAFASGGSGISLRGLTLGDTLVLIDGERTVPYPLLDDNERSFVDLSSIPFTAVQQVQILKDGGSALYGSDAIAGTVNVILRKEYQGFEVSASTGTSSHWDGTTEHVGFIGGEGDLATDGYNWYISGDFRHQDQILAKNRSGQWDSLNFTPWGGFNRTPGVNPNDNPNIPYPASLTGYLIDPNTTSGTPYTFLPGCSALAQTFNRCAFSYPGSQLQPSSTNVDLLGKFTKELGDGWEFGLQASWFDSRTDQVGSYNGDLGFCGATGVACGGTTNIAFGPGVAPTPITYAPVTVPANYPGNPYGVPAQLIYNFPELGGASTLVNTNTYRLLASLSGTAAGWHIKATIGAMYARMKDTATAAIEPAALQTALNNGYILGSSNGVQLFAPPASSTPTSNMDLIDIHGTHKLIEMPGGPLSLAVGVQWVKEGHDVLAPPSVASGVQEGDATFARGNEYDRAVFAELQGDPVKALDVDAQVRYDSYQTFGSAVSPNLGIKFTPWHWIAVRGTWGKGFRAPSVAEGISSGEAFGEGSFTDPQLCPNAVPNGKVAGPGDFAATCEFPLTGVLGANSHLKNVTSTNWTAGIILQPLEQFSASVDYYNIKINNDIIGANSLSGFSSYVRGPTSTLGFCPATQTAGCTSAQLVPQVTPVGTILFASFPYLNAQATHVSGFDVDLKYHWDWGRFGRFTGEATWTHELTYQLQFGGTSYELAGTHGPSSVSGDTGNPKDRFNVRLSWMRGPLTITPSVNFVGHFSISDPSTPYAANCAAALGYNGNFPVPSVVPANQQQFCTVGYFLETNLFVAYQLNGNLQLHLSVRNAFNKQPPIDVMTYGSGSMFYPYDAAFAQDGAVGRFMTLGFTYNME